MLRKTNRSGGSNFTLMSASRKEISSRIAYFDESKGIIMLKGYYNIGEAVIIQNYENGALAIITIQSSFKVRHYNHGAYKAGNDLSGRWCFRIQRHLHDQTQEAINKELLASGREFITRNYSIGRFHTFFNNYRELFKW